MDFAVLLKQVGANIRRARWAKGLTQQEVAARGISYRYYQELERGLRNPTLRMLADLAEILGSSVVTFLTAPTESDGSKRPGDELEPTAPKRGRKKRT